ncbi:MAG: glycosyltransferase family 39 protein, partial [Nanoarchaeota archaeon]
MISKYNKLLLVLIILLASFLRFNQLNTLPALNADEAAVVYNAYSLIQTGKDEHGHAWPIHFESFGDWKPGLFFYIVLPFVKFLGLNEWAVRIPGATLGVLTVLLVYLLVKELFKDRKLEIGNWKLEILAAALLAVSPWHIHFSRGGWEVNAGTFFIVLGLWAFLKGTRQNKWLVISTLAFVASLYTYHAARIVVPLLVMGLLIFYRRFFWEKKNGLLVPVIVGVILLIPLI